MATAIATDTRAREEFLELVAQGTPEHLAGHEVGWSPRKTLRVCAEADMAELIEFAKTRRDDSVERSLYLEAKRGNMQAIALVLLNRRASDFRDVKRIEVARTGTVVVEHVHSLKQSIAELMAESGVEGFQIGGPLDAIEATAQEA